MTNLRALHDTRRTRPTVPHSRLPFACLAQARGGSPAPLLVNTPRVSSPSAALSGAARQRQHARSQRAVRTASPARRRDVSELHVGAINSAAGGDAATPATLAASDRKEEGVARPTVPNREDEEATVVQATRPELLRAETSEFEVVRLAGEEEKRDLSLPHDDDGWELLSLDEDEALQLGYRPVIQNGKAWASVVVSPVDA